MQIKSQEYRSHHHCDAPEIRGQTDIRNFDFVASELKRRTVLRYRLLGSSGAAATYLSGQKGIRTFPGPIKMWSNAAISLRICLEKRVMLPPPRAKG